MYTRGSAWLAFSEHERGIIRPGMLADWVALSEDPLTVEPMALRETRVLATGVGGELVHAA
jgi:predicted amidohydrolase YtcJ